MKNKIVVITFSFLLFVLVNCNKKKDSGGVLKINTNLSFVVKNTFVHNINSFTEGLYYSKGLFYESTGSPDDLPETKSLFGILSLKTGIISEKVVLDKSIFFGEGVAICKNKIYQLTYKNKIGFVYDSQTFRKIGQFTYDNDEGWGLTSMNDKYLIMSDGSNILTFFDPLNFKVEKKLKVQFNGIPINNLNELEYVKGYIYANVYPTNDIVVIDVITGNVVEEIDMSSLYYDSRQKFAGLLEMNGIAYNVDRGTFFITGKMWPCIYEIKLKKSNLKQW